MAYSEVPQITFSDRLVTKPLPNIKISWLPDDLPMPVFLQILPELLQTSQVPGDEEALSNHLRVIPSVPMVVTPGTAIHHTCQGHVELLIHPMVQ